MNARKYIEQQAARWVMRHEEPDWTPQLQKQFDAWLEESAAHKAAFWRLEQGWRRLNTISVESTRFRWLQVRIPTRIGPQLMALAASFVVVALVGVMLFGSGWLRPAQIVTYSTGRGQMSTIQLADGTQIELNTQTSVRVEQTSKLRTVWLDRGEAFFDVVHDPGIPFVVHGDLRKVVDLGTRFDVRLQDRRMIVSVVEGHVRLEGPSADDGGTATILARGDSAIVEGSSTLVTSGELGRIEDELAWREGMIRFHNTPLSKVVREFNRYNEVQLRVADPDIGKIRIGGMFRASNAVGFARLLHDAYGIETKRQGNEIVLSRD